MRILVLAFLVVGMATQGFSAADPLIGADARIESLRKADAEIVVLDKKGRPVPEAKVHVEQVRHAFLFGANIFGLFEYPDPKQEAAYEQAFTGLLNYATLPFYWAQYEPQAGQTEAGQTRLEKMARWCAQRHIAVKGHPLVWHEVYPSWAPMEAGEAQARLKTRVESLVGHYKGLIDRWDVINEATVAADKGDNGESRWIKRDGPESVAGQCLGWAREANTNAFLLYNDYNLDESTEKLAGALASRMDAMGIQSHMHKGTWPLEKIWETCERFGKVGKPLHFTETTVLSGDLMDSKDMDYRTQRKDWLSTPEGEREQADYVERYYTLLFSNEHVEAITWWDLMDGAWLGAPGGLLRKDLTPKPAYQRLMALIKGKWWTRADLQADAQGRARLRGFLGTYRVTVSSPDGKISAVLELKKGSNVWRLK